MSWSRPSRSSVLGLIAAAQGIDRSDDVIHRNLETNLHVAIRTDSPGRPFVDYHTVQTPISRKGVTFSTRRDELNAVELHTVLSAREYLVDTFFTIVLWSRKNSDVNLDFILTELKRPKFLLYAGRKSAPLGLPMNPEIVEAKNFLKAFELRVMNTVEEEVLNAIYANEEKRPSMISVDHDVDTTDREFRIERRRDVVQSRKQWQFTDRSEKILMVE